MNKMHSASDRTVELLGVVEGNIRADHRVTSVPKVCQGTAVRTTSEVSSQEAGWKLPTIKVWTRDMFGASIIQCTP